MKFLIIRLVGLLCLPIGTELCAEPDWLSMTVDNDLFVGNDSGYTNGVYLSWYDVGVDQDMPAPKSLVSPLRWSLPDGNVDGAVNAYTIGQAMITPKDITVGVPSDNDLPYSGLLFFNNTHLAINRTYTDKLSTTIGIVGPSSGAKATQKWYHELIGADDPKGWDSQLKDEVVFKFTRGRLWRSWVSNEGSVDILLHSEAALGTIESSVASGFIMRYGKDLARSYAAPLLSSTKTSNPAAIEGGWYVYAGVNARYIFNQIFTDGNTYRDSHSVDFKKDQIGVTAGLAYSWQNISVTFAVSDTNIIEDELADQLQELTRYGTLTFAWRYE